MKVGVKPSKLITCADVCLEKDGKHSKGKFEYTTFQECDGVAKPKEGKEKNDETGDEKKDVEDKEEKKAARQRRMRRYRF